MSRRATATSEPGGGLRLRHLRDPLALIATGAGCGLAPLAPGTVGTLLGVGVWWLLLADLDLFGRAAVVIAAFAVGVLVVAKVVDRYALWRRAGHRHRRGRRLLGRPASGTEVPALDDRRGSRCFEPSNIVKPWPVSWADRSLHGGLGIMLDDLIAGALAAAVLYGVHCAVVAYGA